MKMPAPRDICCFAITVYPPLRSHNRVPFTLHPQRHFYDLPTSRPSAKRLQFVSQKSIILKTAINKSTQRPALHFKRLASCSRTFLGFNVSTTGHCVVSCGGPEPQKGGRLAGRGSRESCGPGGPVSGKQASQAGWS